MLGVGGADKSQIFFLSRVKKNHEDLRKEWCIHTIRTKTLKKNPVLNSHDSTYLISSFFLFSFLIYIYKAWERKRKKKPPPNGQTLIYKKSSHQFRLKSPPYHSPRALPHPDCQNFQPPLDSPAQLPRGPARIGNTASRP